MYTSDPEHSGITDTQECGWVSCLSDTHLETVMAEHKLEKTLESCLKQDLEKSPASPKIRKAQMCCKSTFPLHLHKN